MAESSGDSPAPAPLAGYVATVAGVLVAVFGAQAVASVFPSGPYIAIALPLAGLLVVALFIRRSVRSRMMRDGLAGIAFGCFGMLLLFLGAG